MTLTTHIIIAAAVTKPLAGTNPVFAFLAGLASHYFADALPHGDYRLKMFKHEDDDKEKVKLEITKSALVANLSVPAIDAALGTLIAAAIIWPDSTEKLLYLAALTAGGILPDFLQAVYYAGVKFLRPLQIFHDTIHTKIKLWPYPLIGIPFQILILILAFYSLL